MRRQQGLVLLLACGALVACRENQVVDPNLPPTAVAKVVNPGDDELVDTLELDFDGEAVTLDLDGSGSTDDDGKITEYRWLSGNTQADGMGRGGPSPRAPGEPAPSASDGGMEMATACSEAKCKVTLEEEGEYVFSLWVKDDDRAFSKPSSVTITFGTPPDDMGGDEDGGVAGDASSGGNGECTPFDGISDTCKECTCNMCPEATSMCGEDCWALIQCVADMCAGDATDQTCIFGMCSTWLLTGGTAAMMTGDCARACTDECSM